MYYVLCLYASYIYITMCNYCELCNSWISILVYWPPPGLVPYSPLLLAAHLGGTPPSHACSRVGAPAGSSHVAWLHYFTFYSLTLPCVRGRLGSILISVGSIPGIQLPKSHWGSSC